MSMRKYVSVDVDMFPGKVGTALSDPSNPHEYWVFAPEIGGNRKGPKVGTSLLPTMQDVHV